MNVFDAIQNRFSARHYQSTPVEKEKLHRILEAARLAPSANNRQEWRFVVVEQQSTRAQLAEAANNQSFVAEAPVIIVCLAETDHHVMSCGQKCYPIDVAIAIDHMTLAATALGLATCWIGAFDAARVKEILNIPDELEVVELLPLGYATSTPKEKRRLTLDKLVHYEKWGGN
ncbi:MAG: nitroreductase family protein [Deltaproteobacteria bacterium]|nr:nitroreductase family protein [Deltaproteobacteria bacterium]MBN2671428.1 nitroreductase family protein [Deltaproteobacteria bacterium]